jgi:hypothetical protein
MNTVLHLKIRAEPETEFAPLAALTLAVLLLTESVLLTLLSVSAIVERHPECADPLYS